MALEPKAPRGASGEGPRAGRVAFVQRPQVILRLTVRLEEHDNADGAGAQSEGEPARPPRAAATVEAASLAAEQAVRRAAGERDLAADARAAMAARDVQASPGPLYVVGNRVPGLRVAGNIDVANRPRVRNADGSVSTVRSMSFESDGLEVLVPTVSEDGRLLTDEQAIAQYQETGRHLGKFDTPAHATAYARRLHEQQAQMLRQVRPPPPDRRPPAAGSGAAVPLARPPDPLSVQFTVVPREAKVELNGFREADKLSATFEMSDLPIHPEAVRAEFVEAFAGTVPAEDFAHPERWIASLLGTPPMFRGYADEESLEASEGELRITVECRSLEARLMDAKINPLTRERRVKHGGEPLKDYVRRLISTIPEFNGSLGDPIGVVLFPNVDPDREPRLDAKLFNRSLQSAQSRAQAGGGVQAAPAAPSGTEDAQDPAAGTPSIMAPTPSAPASISVWDMVVRACLLSGVLPVYDPSVVVDDPAGGRVLLGANNILLVPPQTVKEVPLEGLQIAGGPVDGFSRDFALGGTSPFHSEVRFLVWGSNIATMRVARKYERHKAPRVRVVAYNPDGAAGKRQLQAVYPTERRATSVSAAGTSSGGARQGHPPIEEEVVRVVHGIRDQDQLQQVAVGLYQSFSRREVSVTIETNDVCSYLDPTRGDTHNENPDLLRLRPGTPCRVTVARAVADPSESVVVNGLSEIFDRRFNPAFLRQQLTERGSGALIPEASRQRLDDALAKVERAYSKLGLRDWYYCRIARHTFGEEGYSLEVELANYIEARSGPTSAKDRALQDHIKLKRPGKRPDAHAAAVEAGAARVVRGVQGE